MARLGESNSKFRGGAIVVLGCGVVSPWGVGLGPVERGLVSGECCVVKEHFDGLGQWPAGRCGIPGRTGEDRTRTLLRAAFEDLEPVIRRVAPQVPHNRRAIACASSKGAFDLISRGGIVPDSADMIDLTADAPSRWLGDWWPSGGPVAGMVGACSTGLLNVIQGMRWLQLGMADVVLCGSTEGALVPLYVASLAQMGALTREACRPYDARHDGFAPGEGAALFMLSTEDVAERCGIAPMAVLESGVSAAEAHHETALCASGEQVERLCRSAVARAGVELCDVDLLASHGTATMQGDLAEGAGIARLWPDGGAPPVFSVKGAIGHLMGAAGAVELATCLAAMRAGVVPATLGFDSPARECAALRVLRVPERRAVSRVLKWTLGFGGVMAACVISAPKPCGGR